VQFSISLGAALPSLRFLGEVADPSLSMAERLSLSSLRLRDLVIELNLRSASDAINEAFKILLPEDPRLVSKWTVGMWMALAAAPGHPIKLRLYINQRWDTIVDRYHRIAHLLARFGRAHDVALWCRLAPFVSVGAIPFGVAIDVIPGGVGRFKVYFANYAATRSYWASLLGSLDLGHRLRQVELLAQMCGLDMQRLPPGAMSPSLEFVDDPDERGGLKIDVSCNHLRTSDAKMDQCITRYVRDCGLDPAEYRDVLAVVKPPPLRTNGVSCIQYCSVGLTDPDNVRINIYLGPPS
jgi:hypothetical protein